MKPVLLDTNILVRFISGEPIDQANEVADLFRAAGAGKLRLAVLPMVLAEAVFVLTSFYEHPRAKVAEVLAHLISCPGFQADESERMLHALKLFGAGKLDFVDCYLAAASIREGRTVVSFDSDFTKLHGVTHKKPRDFSETSAGK
jgi:predicted nucleic acid-binding protein